MKNFKRNLIIIMLVTIMNVFSYSEVLAASNPYNQKGPYGINCTWYAWKMAYEKAGISLPGWGNAKNWYNDAKNDGYIVGTTPKANSIIVWGGWTSYGHVGYVETVEGNILHVWDSSMTCIDREEATYQECMANSVSEETDLVCFNNAKRIACEYTISPDEFGITGYIYLSESPKTPTSSSSQNSNNSSTKVESSSEEKKKSNNTYLNSIILSNGSLEFDKEVMEYSLEVENEIDKIEINATVDDKKSTIKGIGEYELNIGVNEIKLSVTAEDNSIREYLIKITRQDKAESE